MGRRPGYEWDRARGILTTSDVALSTIGFLIPGIIAHDVAAVALLTWLVVVKLLMPRLLLFGRRKLSSMVLFGSLIGWTLDIGVRLVTDGHVEPGTGLPVMTLMVPALIANDAQRQGWGRTVLGISLGGTGVAGLMNLLAALLVALGVLHITRPALSPIQAYGPFVLMLIGLVAVLAVGVWWLVRRYQEARPSYGSGVSVG